MQKRRVHVAIIGGGPAASAAAIVLARSGRTVAVCRRTGRGERRVGEILPPAVIQPLSALGVWDRFQALGALPSPGMLCAWGEPEPYEIDFIRSPYGSGWHLDRCRFDAMLAEAAEEAGALIYRDTWVRRCFPDPDGGWALDCRGDECREALRADYLVIATGRAAPPDLPWECRRVPFDRLVSVPVYLTPRCGDVCSDPRALVEAAELGWWYSAVLPDGCLVAAFMTDRELVGPAGALHRDGWWDLLLRAPYTKERLQGCEWTAPPRVVAANTYCRDALPAPDCVLVGDAAVALDPLSGQGITRALTSGWDAAGAITAHVDGDDRALERYASTMSAAFAASLEARARYYGRERRWAQSAFWRARQGRQAVIGNDA